MRAIPPRVTVLVLLVLAGSAGCGRRAEERPPDGTAFAAPEQILQERLQKDEAFRTDPDSPIPPDRRREFRALEYYPFAADFRYQVRLRRFPGGGVPFTIFTVSGKPRPASKVGYVEFPHAGRPSRLQVYRLLDLPPEAPDELFVPFLDATSGVETYGAGRYLDLAPGRDGWYVLDFNLAYHPLCAYGRTDYACPRTPEENRLPFPVRAGERGWAAHTADGAAGPQPRAAAQGGSGG